MQPKVTYLELTDDVELSTEHFSSGTEGQVEFFPIAYDWEHETYSKKQQKALKYKHSEALIIWRLSIVGAPRDTGEDDVVLDDGMDDQIGDMLVSM